MNRAAQGIEAFVSYYAQDDFRFKVFDWARDGQHQWQVDLPYEMLTSYIAEIAIDKVEYPAVYVMNYTVEVTPGTWANEAYLHNFDSGNADLIYRFEYPATAGAQRSGTEGWWGPIVETFEPTYTGTVPLGFAFISVASRESDGWRAWQQTTSENSHIRKDENGFSTTVFAPNYTLIVKS